MIRLSVSFYKLESAIDLAQEENDESTTQKRLLTTVLSLAQTHNLAQCDEGWDNEIAPRGFRDTHHCAYPFEQYAYRDMPDGTITTSPYYTDLNVLVTLK